MDREKQVGGSKPVVFNTVFSSNRLNGVKKSVKIKSVLFQSFENDEFLVKVIERTFKNKVGVRKPYTYFVYN